MCWAMRRTCAPAASGLGLVSLAAVTWKSCPSTATEMADKRLLHTSLDRKRASMLMSVTSRRQQSYCTLSSTLCGRPVLEAGPPPRGCAGVAASARSENSSAAEHVADRLGRCSRRSIEGKHGRLQRRGMAPSAPEVYTAWNSWSLPSGSLPGAVSMVTCAVSLSGPLAQVELETLKAYPGRA